MATQGFVYHPRKLEGRLSTILQQKIRVVIRCYTIVDLCINKENKTFTFKKSHKRKNIRIDDPKTYSGQYEIENIDKENSKLIISVDTTGKNDLS